MLDRLQLGLGCTDKLHPLLLLCPTLNVFIRFSTSAVLILKALSH